jgi:hypothetical protein
MILNTAYAQPKTDPYLYDLLKQSKDPVLQQVIAAPDSFRVQVIYTQINRNRKNQPRFTNFAFNLDSNIYFNPASTVKLPLALMALEKLNNMKVAGVDKYSRLLIDSSQPWQHPYHADSSARNGYPSIAQFIRRAMLISENDPYNRLYQFVGQQHANRRLHELGFGSTRITRQFLGLSPEQNRYTNAMRFVDSNGVILYTQPPAYNPDPFYLEKKQLVGRGYMDQRDSLIRRPIDFTFANNLPLEEFRMMLQTVMIPETRPADKRFRLSEDDYRFMYRYLSQYPSETPYPKYDTSEYYDSYVKFFFRDSTHRLPSYVRVFNKVGWAYGFLIDASYVVDFKHGLEFMLAAVIYVNKDGILNDNRYDYETIGWPFMYQLGQAIYKHELTRKRMRKPKLDKFKVTYETRDVKDRRPAIRNADN